MSGGLRGLQELFRYAERTTSLLVRTRPRGVARWRARLLERWSAGQPEAPALEYAPAPNLSGIVSSLEAAAEGLAAAGALAALYAARARELALEARLVDAIGQPAFAPLARQRFAVSGAEAGRALAWAAEWLSSAEDDRAEGPGALHASDDERDPESLVSQLRSMVGAARLPLRIEVTAELLANAAAGEGVVFVRRGSLQLAAEARRTAVHELEGHALPRLRARQHRLGLFSVGSAHASEDEEGRALWLEQRAGLFEGRRRAALARRHLAAKAVHEGADFVETTRLALTHGAETGEAIDLALRCHRGGGLGREIAYLPALARFEAALDSGFDADRWLREGRLSLYAARQIAALEAPTEASG